MHHMKNMIFSSVLCGYPFGSSASSFVIVSDSDYISVSIGSIKRSKEQSCNPGVCIKYELKYRHDLSQDWSNYGEGVNAHDDCTHDRDVGFVCRLQSTY
jgi:hypothetical protein